MRHFPVETGRIIRRSSVSVAPALSPTHSATAVTLPGEPCEAFFSMYQGVLDIRPATAGGGVVALDQRIWLVGDLLFVSIRLPKGSALHWRHCATGVLDHWYVLLPVGGDGNGCDRVPPITGPLIHSLANPLVSRVEADGLLLLFVPRGLIPSSGPDHWLDRPLDSGTGALLADFMLALDRRLPKIRPDELDRLSEALVSLLSACTPPLEGADGARQAPTEVALLERARRLIRGRLADFDLTPVSICRELGVSRSRLYRLFEPLGGISTYVRRQRLLRTRQALHDPNDGRTIIMIAEQWGFTDASVFSRAFRQEFGLSPKELREQCVRSDPGARICSEVVAREPPRLAELLQRLAV